MTEKAGRRTQSSSKRPQGRRWYTVVVVVAAVALLFYNKSDFNLRSTRKITFKTKQNRTIYVVDLPVRPSLSAAVTEAPALDNSRMASALPVHTHKLYIIIII